MKNLIRWAAALLAAAASAAIVLGSCGGGNYYGGAYPVGPSYYDESIYGYGFGTGLYNYNGGQWKKAATQPFGGATIIGAAFLTPINGFAWSADAAFRFTQNAWSNATPSDLPAATFVDGVVDVVGNCWLAANDVAGNGYLLKLAADGSHQIVAGKGIFSANTVTILSVFVVAGDPSAVHLAAALDGSFEHLRWDGVQASSEVIIPEQTTSGSAGSPDDDAIPADDDASPADDDAIPADDDASPADDDASPSPQLVAAVTGARAAPDGTIWAYGWNTTGGAQQGVFWRRNANPVSWTLVPVAAPSNCPTTVINKADFAAADGAGYAIGNCGHSQVYQMAGPTQWNQLEAPNADGGQYLLRDLSFVSADHGWLTGCSSAANGPLLLVRTPGGLEQATPAIYDKGDSINAVVMFAVVH